MDGQRQTAAPEVVRGGPRYDPRHEEWSLRTGPSSWLVWKHGTLPGDEERLLAEAAAELARESGPRATA